MHLSDFDYYLPEELIAQTPIEPRDASRLLVVDRNSGQLQHAHFFDLPKYLRHGDVLVRNNTRVIPARVFGHKPTGGQVEVLLSKQLTHDATSTTWESLTKPGLKPGQQVFFADVNGKTLASAICVSLGNDDFTRTLKFNLPYPSLLSALAQIGETPLPPYIHTDNPNQWAARYQTLYAKHDGSAASPTAGLHMTAEVEQRLKEMGVDILEVTLHVGLGTFLPVKTDDITQHHMHSEWFSLSESVAKQINQAKAQGRKIISVGTTTTRVLETCTDVAGHVTAQTGETSIFIYPPYAYRCVDGLITNFHLPKSTLLMLVAALVSAPNTQANFTYFPDSVIGQAYAEAVAQKYRFFSFGDGMLII